MVPLFGLVSDSFVKCNHSFSVNNPIPNSYYSGTDTLSIAKSLLGKLLVTELNGVRTSGIISETEAYLGAEDKACHAYNNRLTKRTATMFQPGGIAYVYLCYGIHHLFNIVTHQQGYPHAILVRGIQPKEGLDTMLQRRKKTKIDKSLSAGPGTMSQALGITTALNGVNLTNGPIWLEETSLVVPDSSIDITPRIGIDYAEEDALLPYRFFLKHKVQF